MTPRMATAVALLLLAAPALGACAGDGPKAPDEGAVPTTAAGDAQPAGSDPAGTPGSFLANGPSGDNPPGIEGYEVPPTVACTIGESAKVPVSYKTSGAMSVTFMVDISQVEGTPPSSGTYDIPLTCDGESHTIVLFAVGTDMSTNTQSKVTTLGA
jgi:hypothetical protein